MRDEVKALTGSAAASAGRRSLPLSERPRGVRVAWLDPLRSTERNDAREIPRPAGESAGLRNDAEVEKLQGESAAINSAAR
jgi:hypothetical protein